MANGIKLRGLTATNIRLVDEMDELEEGFAVEHLTTVLAVSDGSNLVYIKTREQAIELMAACRDYIDDKEMIEAGTH